MNIYIFKYALWGVLENTFRGFPFIFLIDYTMLFCDTNSYFWDHFKLDISTYIYGFQALFVHRNIEIKMHFP